MENNTPTKFYETEEGRFCNLCFDPLLLKALHEKENLDPFDYDWDNSLMVARNDHYYIRDAKYDSERSWNSGCYDEYPECELCGYVFEDIKLLDPRVLAEQERCYRCGSKDLVLTVLNNYSGNYHLCDECWSDNYYAQLKELFKTFRHVYHFENKTLKQQMELGDNKEIKRLCIKLISYIERLHTIANTGILDHEDDFYAENELTLLNYIVNNIGE